VARRTLVLLAAAVAALLVLALTGMARAATSPCGTSGNYHDYAALTGHVQYGVQAQISTYEPDLCGSTSASFAWVAEEDPSSTGIVQIGYAKVGSTNGTFEHGWHVFDERKKCSSNTQCPPFYQYWPAPSGTKTYKVGYDSTNSRFDLWYDNEEVDHTVWDPTVEWGSPWDVTLAGETLHCESDVPGTFTSPALFSSIVRKASDNTWGQADNLALGQPECSRYQNAWVSKPSSFSIVTSP
jgi:hypothetical protein